MTGKGADLLIIDDPHSEQEATLGDPSVFDKVFEWYTSGPRQRLQPGGAIVVVMTRWSDRDLTGKIISEAAKRDKHEEWEVIELPAIMPSGNPLWPEFWSLKELEALREELPPSKWNAQYQQQPTGEEGAIVKREWWQMWEKDDPPPCELIIQSGGSSFSQNTSHPPCHLHQLETRHPSSSYPRTSSCHITASPRQPYVPPSIHFHSDQLSI